MTINELRAKRACAWDDAKAFLEAHRNENSVLSEKDDATYAKMVDIVDALDKEIDRFEKAEARDKKMSAPVTEPLVSDVHTSDEKEGTASDEYKKSFKNYIQKKAHNALQEGTDTEGGYLVPVEFEKTLIESRDKVDPIFADAGKITLGSHEKNVPVVASTGAAALIDEEGSYPDTDDSFSQVVFKAHKFGRITKASEELVADAVFDIESYLGKSLGTSIGKCQAGYYWTGSGTGQPQGVCTGATVGVTTASATKITADEIIDLYYSLPEQYRANATWYFSDSTIKAIRKLKDANGQYLWVPGIASSEPATLLGKPVKTSEYIEEIATGKVVGVFGDLKEAYKIADRQGVNFMRMNEHYATTGQVGFRANARSDGHIINTEAVKSIKMA